MSYEVEGEIQEKSSTEGKKKDGTDWKRTVFKVNGMSYSTFSKSISDEHTKGDIVRIEAEDEQREYQGKQITSHNILSVEKLNGGELKVETEMLQTNERVHKIIPKANTINRIELLACGKIVAIATQSKCFSMKELAELTKDFHKELFK